MDAVQREPNEKIGGSINKFKGKMNGSLLRTIFQGLICAQPSCLFVKHFGLFPIKADNQSPPNNVKRNCRNQCGAISVFVETV